MNRREFLAVTAASATSTSWCSQAKPLNILLRSSWQTVNIGDIAHTPGMIGLLEKYRPEDRITLWPNQLSDQVENILLKRFPKLKIAKTKEDQATALIHCDFFLHGSGPGLVGRKEALLAKEMGKPYGFAGITLSDDELKNDKSLLSHAKFIFTRDTDSLNALKSANILCKQMAFGPDATFALDIHDDVAADQLMKRFELQTGNFLCAVPRLRWTPYWEIHPESRKPDPQRSATNEAFAERDHSKMREAITSWVRKTNQKVFLVPEMIYALPRLKPFLYDPLPEDVKKMVAIMDRYWLTAEAASVYARATLVLSFEMHSPIIAVANGTPAILLRQPTDTRKGQMWRDIGLNNWIFEIDQTTGKQISDRVLEIASNIADAKNQTTKAQEFAQEQMKKMMAEIQV